MSKSYKVVDSDGTPEDLVTMAVSELHELGDEVEQWKSGMEGTNLEQSEKYNMLEEAYGQLTEVNEPSVDTWPHHDARIHFTVEIPKRKSRSPSRTVRVTNATGKVAAVINFYESLDDQPEEVTDLVEQLREIADLEVELPGMYG